MIRIGLLHCRTYSDRHLARCGSLGLQRWIPSSLLHVFRPSPHQRRESQSAASESFASTIPFSDTPEPCADVCTLKSAPLFGLVRPCFLYRGVSSARSGPSTRSSAAAAAHPRPPLSKQISRRTSIRKLPGRLDTKTTSRTTTRTVLRRELEPPMCSSSGRPCRRRRLAWTRRPPLACSAAKLPRSPCCMQSNLAMPWFKVRTRGGWLLEWAL